MDPEEITREVINIVKETAIFSEKERINLSHSDIKEKARNDLVSYVDVETEKILTEKLDALLPGSVIHGEETTKDYAVGKYTWIIDPIDGTTNFLHGLPVWCISVALMKEGELLSGVIYDLSRDECFSSWKEGRSYLNEKVINVSSTLKLKDSLIATGFPFRDSTIMDRYLIILKKLMSGTHGIRRLGSAALDLAYLACGRFDGFYEFNLKPWDVAAGALIIKNAGGTITDFSGGENYIFGREIVAGNSHVQPELLTLIKKQINQ